MLYNDFKLASDKTMTEMAREYLTEIEKNVDSKIKEKLVQELYFETYNVKNSLRMHNNKKYNGALLDLMSVINLSLENLECSYGMLDKVVVKNAEYQNLTIDDIVIKALELIDKKFAIIKLEKRDYTKNCLSMMQKNEIENIIKTLKNYK
ncbi:MAG: hypothetical protein PHP83_02745 [Clostridia bacterium]|nr:hypothetical protein [Clostridia bacterium]